MVKDLRARVSFGDREPGVVVSGRKAEHLQIALATDVATRTSAGWDDVHLVHDALPAVDAASIDLTAPFLGRTLALPIVIAGMTGGHPQARPINSVLARVAERRGLAIGVGSQRAALRDPSLVASYSVTRESAPTAFVIGNIGVSQLIAQRGEPALARADVAILIEMIRADALAVHLNYLEESVQPEGQRMAVGTLEMLGCLVKESSVPIVIKETGAGISRDVAQRVRQVGVAAVDVGGVGGTSFAAVEGERARLAGDDLRAALGARFRDWGIPTAVAVVGCSTTGIPVIATGGVRSGLDAAKALALGATVVGIGLPLLEAATRGEAAVDRWVDEFELELRTAIFLSGIRRAADLRSAQVVIVGQTRQWLDDLGYRHQRQCQSTAQ